MSKENLVEKAMLQMKQIEDLVAENAKGILASTMKEEINSLVKESLLSEQALEDEDELISTDDLGMDATDVEDTDVDVDGTDMDVDTEVDTEEPDMEVDSEEDDEDVLDLRDVDNDAALLTVFKAMKDEDGIIVSKSGEDIHLKDENSDNEYLIKMAESIKKRRLMEMEDQMDEEMEDDEMLENDDMLESWDEDEMKESDDMFEGWDEDEITLESDEESEELDEDWDDGDDSVYYDAMNDASEYDYLDQYRDYNDYEDEEGEGEEKYEIDMEDEDDEFDAFFNEKLKVDEQSRARRSNEDYRLSEAKGKMTTKPKGMGMGSPSKFKYKSKPNQEKGFDTKMKQAPKTKGTGKAKFEYKEGENMDGKTKKVTPKMGKTETKEAARTYGMGSKENRGLRKGITPNRNHVYEADMNALKAKNEEYKKALNIFREKLNEVAVFNSNLAYATRLFTEHSTTKKEKINILRRFDDVQSLKESKSLYNTIKNELAETINNTIKESVAVKINNTASTGSSANLIESTTYESPQFLRMKDLMNKIK